MSDEIHVLVKSNGGGRCLAMYYVDPVSGKRVVKTTGTTDQRAAERAAGDWGKAIAAGRRSIALENHLAAIQETV